MSPLPFARTRHSLMLSLILFMAASLGVGWQAPAWAQAKLPATAIPWQKLSAGQKAALQPLAAQWSQLPAIQQQKWLAMANRFPQLSQQEQSRLHQRMSQWASMSSAERQQARRNFDTAREGTSTQERKAKWEAYQNLDEQERKAFGASEARPPVAVELPSTKPEHTPAIKPSGH